MNYRIIGAGLALLVLPVAAVADVTDSRTWTERYEVTTASPTLGISNIWGNVRVRTGDDGVILVTTDERLSASNEKMLERARVQFQLDIESSDSGVSIVVGDRNRERWQNWDPCRKCRADIQFDIVVPKGTVLDVSTVMDGSIDVDGVGGQVSARNVNGPIKIAGMRECRELESVNGRVDIKFDTAPGLNCSIETINGDVTLDLPSNAGLDVALDTFNGRVTSDFETDVFSVPPQVEYVERDGSHRYRIQQSAGLRLQGGGATFTISSLNGDVRFRKN